MEENYDNIYTLIVIFVELLIFLSLKYSISQTMVQYE